MRRKPQNASPEIGRETRQECDGEKGEKTERIKDLKGFLGFERWELLRA